MNEQKINACRALASIFSGHEEVTDEEAAFVGRAALDLGLDDGELKLVQQSLGADLDYDALLASVKDVALRRFLFRRVVAAVLTDAQITDSERVLVRRTAKAFGWDQKVADEYVGWMQEGIDWEKRGEKILSRLG